MGVVCSRDYKRVVGSKIESQSRSSSSNASSTQTTATMKTLQSASVWNPFQISRKEAEDLLLNSDPGSFVFSHDLASELFISLSVGKYVCHHAIMSRDHGYYIGAMRFESVGDVIAYYKEHPLGEVTLTEEFRQPLPLASTTIQTKPHPDFSISSPASRSNTSETNSASEDNGRKPNTITMATGNGIHRPSPIEEENSSESETEELLREDKMNSDKDMLLAPDKSKSQTLPLSRKVLLRSEAIDRQEIDTSGVDQEIPSCITPLLPRKHREPEEFTTYTMDTELHSVLPSNA
ncbi:uncharacterized protein LOC5513204 isoform X2 [Nematostella vectensis]|uniref:uncharacterized protein LOC5513204 isoform X2 n=1 Tax=Nematostella vectensis TaxID=45351 RepID=UPI00139014B5|nr:uncharacterized protein LOC5513204 isoform X2 [Nematostella vectensis]